jgi:hypothetical protein
MIWPKRIHLAMEARFHFMNDQLILYFPSLKNSANIGHDRFGTNRSDRKKSRKPGLRGMSECQCGPSAKAAQFQRGNTLQTSRLKPTVSERLKTH